MSITRRRLLETAGASALFAAVHDIAARAGVEAASRGPRLAALRLLTAASPDELEAFYRGRLGLAVLSKGKREITVAGGRTPITFVVGDEQPGAPFYHFAFNIPENKIRSAHDWQLERTAIDPIGEHLRDPGYPEGVVHFRSWNAHSVFFWDPAGNLVEYIARHDLENGAAGPFTSDDILYASEIAFIVDDVAPAGERLRRMLDLDDYRPGSESFAVIGDEEGLLLVFRRGREWGLDPENRKSAEVFPTVAWVRGSGTKRFAIEGHPHEVRVES